MKGIQFIGTQRSGSNLLRVMLNQMKEITAPHPPHILQNFSKFLPTYGDLCIHENFENLVADVCDWVNNNPVTWECEVFETNQVMSLCNENTLTEVFRVIYEAIAKTNQSEFWSCKSMANMNFANDLEAQIKPYYLYLYRDGRDVALSFKKAIVGEKHIYHLAQKWKSDQEACLKLKESVPADRFIEVRYEDLVNDAESVMRMICSKIGIEFQESFNDYHKSSESKNTSTSGEMWKNVKKPVMKNNFGKYKTQMSQEDLLIFESVAGNVLTELGYELTHKSSALIQDFTTEMIKEYNSINNNLKKEAQQNAAQEDLEKRQWHNAFKAKMASTLEEMQKEYN